MKKIFFSLIASLVLSQTAFAATSPLIESVLEYEAIVDYIGADVDSVFSASEFIVDIKRLTNRIDCLGEVKYRIVTRDTQTSDDSDSCRRSERSDNDRLRFYIAILEITANQCIGPNTIEVISIEPVHHNNH